MIIGMNSCPLCGQPKSNSLSICIKCDTEHGTNIPNFNSQDLLPGDKCPYCKFGILEYCPPQEWSVGKLICVHCYSTYMFYYEFTSLYVPLNVS